MHFVKKYLTAAGVEVGFPQPRKDAFPQISVTLHDSVPRTHAS
jgi:hypothetical protein